MKAAAVLVELLNLEAIQDNLKGAAAYSVAKRQEGVWIVAVVLMAVFVFSPEASQSVDPWELKQRASGGPQHPQTPTREKTEKPGGTRAEVFEPSLTLTWKNNLSSKNLLSYEETKNKVSDPNRATRTDLLQEVLHSTFRVYFHGVVVCVCSSQCASPLIDSCGRAAQRQRDEEHKEPETPNPFLVITNVHQRRPVISGSRESAD
ncbi:Hypothetical predicted protein [Xyrichtys novacula]|uniref:Uncharacterized protein n=1 Tax=Xyrichtys novacula TaxID=13765 RepID=A0AAV1FVI6_XYRNO|nr:Hypothetical predicted protein [Xyrichtys novacula]